MEEKVSLQDVAQYMAAVSHRVLDMEVSAVRMALEDSEETLHKFVSVGHERRLMVSCGIVGDKKESEILIHTDVQTNKHRFSIFLSVMFIKCNTTIEAGRPLGQQIYFCQMKNGAPYEAMLNFVRHAFLPFSRSIMAVDKDESKEYTDFNTLRTVNSTLSELEISLLRCQQNIEIPQIRLEIHPVVKDILSRKTEDEKLSMEDLPKLDMDNFLNEITRMVSDWKKLISSVTKLDRDVSSGSTKEEIHFWVSMESTLKYINSQIRSRGVSFMFDILKENQRFIATTGFREECNLDGCSEKVKIYTDLLRDFPIRNLIEAVTVSDLTQSVAAIFHHIRTKNISKIKYPLKRALGLVRTVFREKSNLKKGFIMQN